MVRDEGLRNPWLVVYNGFEAVGIREFKPQPCKPRKTRHPLFVGTHLQCCFFSVASMMMHISPFVRAKTFVAGNFATAPPGTTWPIPNVNRGTPLFSRSALLLAAC